MTRKLQRRLRSWVIWHAEDDPAWIVFGQIALWALIAGTLAATVFVR